MESKILKTVLILFGLGCLGMSIAMLGPTIVTLGYMLGADTKQMSSGFFGWGAGLLAGTTLGGILFSKVTPELLMGASLMGTAVVTVSVPFSSSVWVFIIVCCGLGICIAITNTGLNSYTIQLWSGHKLLNSILQAIQFFYSLGTTISPLVIRPFIYDLPEPTSLHNSTDANGTYMYHVSHAYNDENTTDYGDSSIRKEVVDAIRIPYLITASIILLSSVAWFIMFIVVKLSSQEGTDAHIPSQKSQHENVAKGDQSRKFKRTIISLMFLFYFFYMFVEGIQAAMLATYVVKGLGWPANHGPLIMSVFFGCTCLMRFVGTFIAVAVSPMRIVLGSLIVVIAGCSLLVIGPNQTATVWCAAVLLGGGMALVFAGGFAWAEQHVHLTSSIVSLLLIAVCAGNMIGPTLTGLMFDEFGHQSFAYCLLASALITLTFYIVGVVYVRYSSIARLSTSRSETLHLRKQETMDNEV